MIVVLLPVLVIFGVLALVLWPEILARYGLGPRSIEDGQR